MVIKESNLKLLDFAIFSSICEYNEGEIYSDKKLNEGYPITLDCDISLNEKVNAYRIFVNISINSDRLPGYYVKVAASGYFSFDKEMSDNDISILLQYSGLQMCISNVRGYIASITSNYPYGKYLFPSIDLNDFVKRKVNNE